MSENKDQLRSDQDIADALTEAETMQEATPLIDQFLQTLTATNLGIYATSFPAAMAAENEAVVHQSACVATADASAYILEQRISHMFNEMNDKIAEGEYDKSVRGYFNINVETGVHPNMDTPVRLIAVAGKVATGCASMVTDSIAPFTGFTAASVASRLVTYNIDRAAATASKIAENTAMGNTHLIRPFALAAAKQVQLEVVNHHNHLSDAEARTLNILWGISYETSKLKTPIKMICFMPDGTTKAVMADLRIGKLKTADGKVAKAGVKGRADAQGERTLDTTQVGSQYVIARIIGCADAEVPVTIVAGVSQTITVNFVVGTSSL
jgi:hypothetical protein